MDQPKCELDAATVVLRGTFNPAIFQPAWLAAKGLIRPEEADSAHIEAITPVVTSFSAEWLNLQVVADRFVATATDPAHHGPLRDLVLAIFTLLEHTPATQMGLNRTMHYRMPSEERWHSFGHFLVPKDPWRKFMQEPRTQGVAVQGRRAGSSSKAVTVKVEPSKRFPNGVVFDYNEHFEETGSESLKQLLGHLKTSWSESLAFCQSGAEQLLQSELGEKK